MSAKSLSEQYPLHWLVWHNNYEELEKELDKNQHELEVLDPRNRTPLMLAVTLGYLESTRILLRHNVNVNLENKEGWTVLHEAVSTGDPEIVQLVLQYRDYQRYSNRLTGIPDLLRRLRDAPDFYVEMKWEFTSWVPLVSRMCPSDTYRVYKSGANVRIDTTLLGFDQSNWQRGNRSYIFKGQADSATVMEVDHELAQVYSETMRVVPSQLTDITVMRPSDSSVCARLTAPIVTTYIDTDKISFERNKSGIWGWRSDKTENVNGCDCKVFSASNVEVVTKTRTEHLTDADKAKCKSSKTPLQSFLGIAEQEENNQSGIASNGDVCHSHYSINNPCSITPEEYFNSLINLEGKDIGRPKEVTGKTQKFKATIWLCESYPLSLQEQVIPIIDLMAISNAHFAKLRDFITLQLPSGFPVKIEIPLFHVLNARITFGNIFGNEEPIPSVTRINNNVELTCVVDESAFEVPSGYTRLGDTRRDFRDEDDELLQFAIQQSLLESGTEDDQVTIWEALTNRRPALQTEEERLMQRAIQESLLINQCNDSSLVHVPETNEVSTSAGLLDEHLRIALELSEREKEEEERKHQEEQEMLERVLQLSLTEK